jgi:hypothetical protein
LFGCGWWFSGGGLSAVGPAGLHNPSRPPTHKPAPSRKSPLPPRAGIHRRGPFGPPLIARTASSSEPSRFGVGFRSNSTRCAWRQFNRVIARTPLLLFTQPVRVQLASESGKPRERSAADRSRRMFERPGGREFAPALAERGRGQSGICRTAALSAARMDTDGPCALPEITAPATRRDSSAQPVWTAAHR